jgi:tetratricopeptide (TPR) repeat protein
MLRKIEKLIDRDDWPKARKAILAALKRFPDDHWLLTRLGLTYYEQRNYNKALEIEEKAYKLTPNCPLVRWDYAGSLQALERHKEAIKIYRRIVANGVDKIAYGECGEGKAWARGLIADCHYRLSMSYQALGQEVLSLRAFAKHLDLRGPGCHSIYPLKKMTEKYQKQKNKRRRLNTASRPTPSSLGAF